MAYPGKSGGALSGFRYTLGSWGGQGVIRRLYPVFQAAADNGTGASARESKTVLARDGYVVGGLLVDYDDVNVIAVRVIFVRRKDGEIDAKVQYKSDWIGVPGGKNQKQLAGNGETIVGAFGREGLNLAAIGLLMPSNVRKTELLGGKGGSPFVHTSDAEKPVLGFRYAHGNWGGPVMRQLHPLYEPEGTDEAAPGENLSDTKIIMAREGYVVSGLLVEYDDVNVIAIRVIFARSKDGRADASDKYTSDWIGNPSGKQQRQLAGDGAEIVGIFGRQGLNLASVGLLAKSSSANGDSPPVRGK